MKQLKIISLWLMLAVTSLFAGCEKIGKNDDMAGRTTVTVTVSPTDTRTVNNGMKTQWAEGDEISVFQTISGGSSFKNNKFTVTDVDGGVFSGSVSGTIDASKSYDWYAVYPYIASIPSPANKGNNGYISVGANIQMQKGPDSRAHLAGSKMSAWARAKGVAGSSKVSLAMHQFASVIAVKVTNLTDKPVSISNVNITADKNIAGTYFADITGESPVLVPSGEGYVYKSVSLNVSDAVLLAGASGRFYVAVTPFTASSLDVTVNGLGKTLSFGKDVEFLPGHIKTLPFSLDKNVEADIELSFPAVQPAEATFVSVDCRGVNAPSGAVFDAAWTADWIRDCNFAGGKLTVSFEANTTSSQRSANIDVILNDADGYELSTKTMTLTQNGVGQVSSWTRVTAVSDITSGGTFIIGYESTANSGVLVPMRSIGSASTSTEGYMYSGNATGTSSTDDTIDMSDVANTESYEVEIVPSTAVSGAVCIKVGNLYVGGENTKNKCKLYAAQSANTSFEVSIAANDVVTLKIGACSSYHTLQYNASSPRFTIYNGGQKNLVLYKKSGDGGGDSGDDDGDDSDDDGGGSSDDGGFSAAGWFELPSIADSDFNRIDDRNSSYHYAYHKFSIGNSKMRNYSVCYSSQHHCAMWVAAPRHSCYKGSSGRSNSYGRDPDIPANIQYSSSDTGAGCNKGHLLGSAERTCCKEANKQVFYYSNIAPQYSSGFNTGGGGWNKLEDFIDTKVCADTLYEVVGCYFEAFTDGYGFSASPKTISYGGRSDVHCPTMFYYAVLRTKKGNSGKSVASCSADQLQCVAFVRSHNNGLKGQAVTQKEMMSIADLEKLTGFEYFVNVPNAPKNTFNPGDWL